MKLPLMCMECFQANGHPSSHTTMVDLKNGEVHEHTCPAGHVTHTVLQQMQFELLFEAAFLAAVDGYCREAVGTFAAALERFEEFAIRVCSRAAKIEKTTFDEAWKEVRNMSERQHGAYVFLYGVVLGKMPGTLTDSQRHFRNNVVHKGTFCNESDALQFGEQVRSLIESGIADLRKTCSSAVDATVQAAMASATQNTQKGKPATTMFIATVVSLIERDGKPASLMQLANEVRQGKRPRWLR